MSSDDNSSTASTLEYTDISNNLKNLLAPIMEEFHKKNPTLCISKIQINASDGSIEDIQLINRQKSEETETAAASLVGGNNNFSETSSINGSFLNNRMNKHLRRSMMGGGNGTSNNSDTLASITELQRMPKYKSNPGNFQGGGGGMSKSNFIKKMHDAGITSTTTSDFCG